MSPPYELTSCDDSPAQAEPHAFPPDTHAGQVGTAARPANNDPSLAGARAIVDEQIGPAHVNSDGTILLIGGVQTQRHPEIHNSAEVAEYWHQVGEALVDETQDTLHLISHKTDAVNEAAFASLVELVDQGCYYATHPGRISIDANATAGSAARYIENAVLYGLPPREAARDLTQLVFCFTPLRGEGKLLSVAELRAYGGIKELMAAPTAELEKRGLRRYEFPLAKLINGAKRTFPLGFDDQAEFLQAAKELRQALKASGVTDGIVGVRGSSVTGSSVEKGTEFHRQSDIDFFVESDTISRRYKPSTDSTGFVNPDELMKDYPALEGWSIKWCKRLQRKITPAAFAAGKVPNQPAIVVD